MSRRAKAKERGLIHPAPEAPLVALLNLLHREKMFPTQDLMDSYATLLSSMTKPLLKYRRSVSEQTGVSR